MLCILTSKRVLLMPFTGRNHFLMLKQVFPSFSVINVKNQQIITKKHDLFAYFTSIWVELEMNFGPLFEVEYLDRNTQVFSELFTDFCYCVILFFPNSIQEQYSNTVPLLLIFFSLETQKLYIFVLSTKFFFFFFLSNTVNI